MNNLIPLKFNEIVQKGGNKYSEFIPYEEHHLLPAKERINISKYCPDTHPFLCKENTLGRGFCKQTDIACNNTSKGRFPINYRP